MLKSINKGYAAALLVLGTTRFFLFADFMFAYDAIISPHFSKQKFKRPPNEILGIVGILAVSSILSPNPNDGLQTAFRVFLLALVLPTYTYGFHFKKVAGFSLSIIALISVAQITVMPRSIGLHMNATLLAETALVFAPIYWLEIGLACAVIMTVSIARSPMVALIIFAVFNRQRYYIMLVAVTAAMFLVYATISTPERVTIPGLVWAVENRVDSAVGFEELPVHYSNKLCGERREIEYTPWGYGFTGFCDSTGQPRPHNIYVLSFYELGSLFIPFWFLIMYAARRLQWWRFVPLLALGLVTDELFARPEGIYLIAVWIIATHHMQTRRTHDKNVGAIT